MMHQNGHCSVYGYAIMTGAKENERMANEMAQREGHSLQGCKNEGHYSIVELIYAAPVA